MTWLGAEFSIAAVSDRLLPVGEVTGAIRVGKTAVPFPDERYRTVAVSLSPNAELRIEHSVQPASAATRSRAAEPRPNVKRRRRR